MKRSAKRYSPLYEYLDTTGVLSTGTSEDIETAKKKYWAQYRKVWKKQKRKEQKSFEVFFSMKETKLLAGYAIHERLSITGYIKKAALESNSKSVSPVIAGEIRQSLMQLYYAIVSMNESDADYPMESGTLLTRVEDLKANVMKLISLKPIYDYQMPF